MFLKNLSSPFYYIIEKDNGIYNAMNKGIECSNGKWLYFLGADDQLYNKNTLLNIFSKINNQYDLILGRIQYDFSKEDSYFIKKKNGIFIPSWSKLIWLKNTIHHQGIIYKKDLFSKLRYDTQYKILSDYAFNLNLYNHHKSCKIINDIISICGSAGVSKNYNWKLYKEEIKLKSQQTSFILFPFISLLCIAKYLIKKN